MVKSKSWIKLLSYFPSIGILLLIALIVRLILHDTVTYTLDLNTFIAWGRRLQDVGFSNFYQQWSDYLPGYLYILWFISGLEKLLPLTPTLLFKLPAILADISVGYLIYKIVNERAGKRIGLFTSAAFLFNPAVFSNSTLWGQVDMLTALFSICAIYFFDKKWILSAVALSVGVIIKPQAALAVPVVLLLMLRYKWNLIVVLKYISVSIFTGLLLFLPFSGQSNIFAFIFERFQATVSQYPYTSINAYNFWGLGGFWIPDDIGLIPSNLVGMIITGVLSLGVLIFGWRKKADPYFLLAVLIGIHFMFFTRMHERHLLPLLIPLAISLSSNYRLIIPYVGFSITYVANLWFAYYWTNNDFKSPYPDFVNTLFILINIFMLLLILFSSKLRQLRIRIKSQEVKIKDSDFVRKNKGKLLIGILLFTLATRLFGLSNPSREYFDEVYHAFTARLVTEGDPKAWEWWNPHPEGFAYEWTHPPFAKLAMAGSMLVFGQNSFAWRFSAVIFGTGVVYLTYLIGKRIFDSEEVSLIAATLVSLDGLVLVMSRIGMNDIYLLFFLLLTFYFFLKEKYLLSSIAYGLALSSKWSALWLIPLLLVTFISYRRRINLKLAYLVLIPPIMYLASYFPMFVTGHDLNIWWGMQKQMWWYHTSLDADHAYTSPWWSWPMMLRPVWLYVERVGDSIANIYAMGNPIVLWTGLVSVILGVYELLQKRYKQLALVIFGWMIFFLPWAASPRIMFFYHYLPSIPFLALTSAYVLGQDRKILKLVLLLSLVSFIYFYPHWTGIEIPVWLSNTYYWLRSWR